MGNNFPVCEMGTVMEAPSEGCWEEEKGKKGAWPGGHCPHFTESFTL